jgi:hypothetical protein
MKPIPKTIKMTKAQWNAWEKHLLSGKIKQANACMEDDDGAMCCLGVLEYALEGKVRKNDGAFPSDSFLKTHNITFLDEQFRTTTLAYSSNAPYLTGGYANELNDKLYSFRKIAQRLRSRIEFIKPLKGKKLAK